MANLINNITKLKVLLYMKIFKKLKYYFYNNWSKNVPINSYCRNPLSNIYHLYLIRIQYFILKTITCNTHTKIKNIHKINLQLRFKFLYGKTTTSLIRLYIRYEWIRIRLRWIQLIAICEIGPVKKVRLLKYQTQIKHYFHLLCFSWWSN